MEEPSTLRWRRDVDTSPPIRVAWALGLGSLLAAIALVVTFRLFAVATEAGLGSVVLAALAGLAATTLAVGIARGATLSAIVARAPGTPSEETDVDRVADVLVATVVVGAVVFALGQIVSGNVGNMLAALSVPLALVAIVLASFFRSRGALDADDATLYLFEPDEAVDLETVAAVSVRAIGDDALVTLSYDQSDGVYVAGPRRLFVPLTVARELETLVESR